MAHRRLMLQGMTLVLLISMAWSSLARQAPAAQALRSTVHLNQVGYLPSLPKRASIASASTSPLSWQLKNSAGTVVASGTTSVFGNDAASGDHIHSADFSGYTTPGTGYTLTVGGSVSNPFDIGSAIYNRMKYDALAYFYHNRSGIAITLPYAGRADLTRPAGHVGVAPNQGDTSVPCAPGIGCSYSLDVRGGWYDAGDHGKYVVNGGISVWTMLNQYERNKHLGSSAADFADGRLQIPENANGVPDILDEARWELEFLMRMQVPSGQPFAGMAHHKMHDASWTGLPLRPDQDPQARQLRPVSTAATLNLAATAAQCARIWQSIDAAFAAKCLASAERAWGAAQANPALFIPGSDGTGGGAYNDDNVSDEFYWAAAELYITTGNSAYRSFLTSSPHYRAANVPTWGGTKALGTISLAVVPNGFSAADVGAFRASIAGAADGLLSTISGQGYRVPIALYDWGSNSDVANAMLLMGLAHDFTGQARYLAGVVDGMDYLLGRNALDQSYVTGYGENAVQNPHHRFWAFQANNSWPRPPAGALSGGPNPGLQDPVASAALSGCRPQRCWIDDIGAWSTNEITINWNAPLAWAAAYLDEKSGGSNDPSPTPTRTSTSGPSPTATAVPPVGSLRLLDDFESGSLSAWSTFRDAGSSVSTALVAPGQLGNGAMRVSYSIASYGGVQQSFGASQSWSAYGGIRFGFSGGNSGATFRLEVVDNSPNAGNSPDAGERWAYTFVDNVAGWRTLSVPWAAFSRRDDWQPAGAPSDGFGRSQVWGFSLAPLSGSSSFQLDQVELYDGPNPPTFTPTSTSTTTPSATSTSTGTSTPTRTGTSQANPNLLRNGGFETDADANGKPDSWAGSNSVATSSFARSSAARYAGSYSLRHTSGAEASYMVSQVVGGVSPGTSYSFSGWTNIPATSNTFSYKLELVWRNASNVVLRTDTLKTYATATNGWSFASGTRVAPAGATSVVVRMNVAGLSATIYADAFALRRAS